MNNRGHSKAKFVFMIAGILYAVFVIFLIKGIITNISDAKKEKEYSQTTGTIVKINEEEREYSTKTGDHYKTIRYPVYISVIEYTVNGVSYTITGVPYESPEQIGEQRNVFYNPQNPTDSVLEGTSSSGWTGIIILTVMLIIVGGIFIVVGIKFKEYS